MELKVRYKITDCGNAGVLLSPIKEFVLIDSIEKSEAYFVQDGQGMDLILRKEIVDRIGGLPFFDRMEKYGSCC